MHRRRLIRQRGPCRSGAVRERCVNSRPGTHTPTRLPAATRRAPQERQIKNDNHRVSQEMQVSLLKDAHATKASNYLQLFCHSLARRSPRTPLTQSAFFAHLEKSSKKGTNMVVKQGDPFTNVVWTLVKMIAQNLLTCGYSCIQLQYCKYRPG